MAEIIFKPRIFKKVVAAAATREKLTSNKVRTPSVVIQAEVSNTGQIYVGDDQVAAAKTGIELDSGDAITLTAPNVGDSLSMISLEDVWVDSSVSTDGMWVTYLERVA